MMMMMMMTTTTMMMMMMTMMTTVMMTVARILLTRRRRTRGSTCEGESGSDRKSNSRSHSKWQLASLSIGLFPLFQKCFQDPCERWTRNRSTFLMSVGKSVYAWLTLCLRSLGFSFLKPLSGESQQPADSTSLPARTAPATEHAREPHRTPWMHRG